MAGKCKICHSDLKDRIEERIFKGEGLDSIATWCKSQGLTISAPSVLRHKKNHFEPTKTENPNTEKWQSEVDRGIKKSEVDYTTPFIDSSKLMKEIEKEIEEKDVFGAVIHDRKITQLMLEKIVQKQLVIVHELQEQYGAGTAGYPEPQIRGLKILLDTINTLPTYADKTLIEKMAASSEDAFENKVEKRAIETAKKAAPKYKPWDCLLKGLDLSAPTAYLEEYVKVMFPLRSDLRTKWIKEQAELWGEVVVKHMPTDYGNEMDIKINFVSMYENYLLYDVEFLKGFIKDLIKDYKTPTLCYTACEEDAEANGDPKIFLIERLYKDPVFIKNFQPEVDSRLIFDD